MKQWIVIIVSCALILSLNFCQCKYLKSTGNYLLADITDIENALNRKDYVSCSKSILELENTWRSVENIWDIFGEHDDIESVEEAIQSMKVYVANEEDTELANEYTLLETRIKNVINTEKLAFKNIF